MNLGVCVCALRFMVKVIAVCLLSILSFFILDVMFWVGIVEGGLTPIGFTVFFITRAGAREYLIGEMLKMRAQHEQPPPPAAAS